MQKDRKKRTEAAGAAIEPALQNDDLQEAWMRLKAWYKDASDRPPKPAQEVEKYG
ncbi:MAG TPA: hypothetical protein V6D20_11100 [Candidatus Obscuribacterales bacterium]